MNDETLPIEESSIPETEVTFPTETIAFEVVDGALTGDTIYTETSADVVYLAIEMERIGSDMLHADLFGSFLICGTLIGLFLFGRIHGT